MAPTDTVSEKEAILDRCFGEGMMLAFPHDPEIGGVAVDGTKERPIVAQKLPL
jgi:hypothetical protein